MPNNPVEPSFKKTALPREYISSYIFRYLWGYNYDNIGVHHSCDVQNLMRLTVSGMKNDGIVFNVFIGIYYSWMSKKNTYTGMWAGAESLTSADTYWDITR